MLSMRCGVAVFLAVPYNEVEKTEGLGAVVVAQAWALGEQEEEGAAYMDDIINDARRIELIADGIVDEMRVDDDRFPGLRERLREISELADMIQYEAEVEKFRALS